MIQIKKSNKNKSTSSVCVLSNGEVVIEYGNIDIRTHIRSKTSGIVLNHWVTPEVKHGS